MSLRKVLIIVAIVIIVWTLIAAMGVLGDGGETGTDTGEVDSLSLIE
jgi:ferric-dicitrate binding protein FerR (iron transport regulator)